MNERLTTVSVGIPAYNEERNIKLLLQDLLSQKQAGWQLAEVLVACDGCSDNTAAEARSLNSELVTVLEHHTRRGQTARFAEMMDRFQGSVLILFDADVKLGGPDVISHMIAPFDDPSVMLTSGNKRPLPPNTFVEHGIYSTFDVFYQSKLGLNGTNNIFSCQGGCLALRRSFAKTVRLPEVISNDAYLYLECARQGYTFKYVNHAVVYYQLAGTLRDYLRQLARGNAGALHRFLSPYFGHNAREAFRRPLHLYLLWTVQALLKRPFPTLFIALITVLAKPYLPLLSRRYTCRWPVATSTKLLSV